MAFSPNPAHSSATFVPGGMDDYYMPSNLPELVAPAPQRVMPEVTGNIQNGIANMSLDSAHSRVSSVASSSYANKPSPVAPQGQFAHTNTFRQADVPSFSPFPKITNPPPNIPPSDEDKEATLENARNAVLTSNDPEMQLSWAQDALQYCEISQMNEERISQTQQGRPQTPQTEHQLRVDATNVVNFLADQHHPKAEFLRGMWLEFGKFGMRMDKREAFRCYSRAADKGYARAQYRIGMQYEQSNDPSKALIHYNKGVSMGDSASNYRLGMMTLLGQHGQTRDFQRGISLVRQAADTADENAPQGSYVYGMLLAHELPQVSVPEEFLPANEPAARMYIEKAAFLGFAKAQVKMGSAYELCTLGCEFSPAFSLHYNALASRQGELDADMALSKWFLCGYEGVFEKNEELAYVYAMRAAQGGLPTAQFAMGYFYEVGVHVPVNLNKAMEWYQKALDGGNQDASARIEGIQHNQTLTKSDHERTAINRIKSQYGSRRGGRPAKYQQAQAPTLATIPAEPNNMSNFTPSPHPPRGSSRTPVPYPDDRPATTAPYPGDGGPHGGFLNTNAAIQRPSSAVSGLPPNPAAVRNRMGPDRPATTVAAMGSPGPGGRMGLGGRVASAGQIPQGGYGRGGAPPRQPSPGGRLDIGFTAPPSSDVRARPGPPGGFGGPQAGRQSPAHGPPGGFGGPQAGRQSPAHGPPHAFNNGPPRTSSAGPGRPMHPGGVPQSQSMPNFGGPPSGPSPPPKPIQNRPSMPPPGKGPKTFDEMGVPKHKDDNECTIM